MKLPLSLFVLYKCRCEYRKDAGSVFLPAETGFAGAGEAGSIWRMRTWKTEHTSKKRAHTITAVNRFR